MRKEKDSTLTCPKWAGRKVEDEMKEIVYFGTYEDPKMRIGRRSIKSQFI